MKKIITLSILLFIAIFSSAQNNITIEIINMTYSSNGNPVPDCGTIDLESEDYVPLTFEVLLTRDYNPQGTDSFNNQYGTGTVHIELYSSTNGMLGNDNTNINTWSWFPNSATGKQTVTLYKNVNLNVSEYGLSDNELYAIYNCNTSPLPESCKYNIIKDEVPAFELNPSSTTVSCDSTTSKTFSVSNTNNSPGTLEYYWSVGDGWKRNGNVVHNFTTTTSNITLVPYQYPPSNVNVTPILDGVAYEQLTSIVSLSSFYTNNSVIGSSSLCTSSNYHLQSSLPSGQSVVWQSSNTSLATILQNGNNATLTAVPNQSGTVTITARITNSCNQTNSKTFDVFVGSPIVPTNSDVYGGWDNVPVGYYSQLHVDWIQGSTGYLWTITPYDVDGPRFVSNNSTSLTTTSRYVNINWGTDTELYAVTCKAINSCSQSYIGNKVVNVFDGSNNPCPVNTGGLGDGDNNYYAKTNNSDSFEVTIFPNPTNNGEINIRKTAPNFDLIGPCNNEYINRVVFNNPKNKILNHIEILDMYGNIVFKNTYKSEEITINNLNLKKGIYFLRFTNINGVSKKKTIQIN